MSNDPGWPHNGTAAMPVRIRKLEALSEAQNHRCAYCGVRFEEGLNRPASPSVDEIVPQSTGGKRWWENQVAACRACNAAKGSADAFEFYTFRLDLLERGVAPGAEINGGMHFGKHHRRQAEDLRRALKTGARQVEAGISARKWQDRMGLVPCAKLGDFWPEVGP